MSVLQKILIFTFVSITFASYAKKTKEVSDRELIALLELRSRTAGEQWTHVWDLTKPVAEWHGVTIKDKKVIRLDLSNNNLRGNLPLTIGNLENLEFLDLSDNYLTGRIPRELRKFDALKHFDLSNNQFGGTLPQTVNRLTNLVFLNVENNILKGELPHTLVELSALQELFIADNKFVGEFPVGMEKLKNLDSMKLGDNNFDNLDNLRPLAAQQKVYIDIDVNNEDFKELNFEVSKSKMAELKFTAP